MKELFEAYAQYNKKADEALMEIMKKLPGDALNRDLGTYFKSVLGTFTHLILMNVMWFKRTNGLLQNKYRCINGSDVVKMTDNQIKTGIEADHTFAFALKSRLDDLFGKYAQELDEKDLETRVQFKNIHGESLERTYWHTIVHIFNHETHHRGEISAMLDQLKVTNDYSGFNKYME